MKLNALNTLNIRWTDFYQKYLFGVKWSAFLNLLFVLLGMIYALFTVVFRLPGELSAALCVPVALAFLLLFLYEPKTATALVTVLETYEGAVLGVRGVAVAQQATATIETKSVAVAQTAAEAAQAAVQATQGAGAADTPLAAPVIAPEATPETTTENPTPAPAQA